MLFFLQFTRLRCLNNIYEETYLQTKRSSNFVAFISIYLLHDIKNYIILHKYKQYRRNSELSTQDKKLAQNYKTGCTIIHQVLNRKKMVRTF